MPLQSYMGSPPGTRGDHSDFQCNFAQESPCGALGGDMGGPPIGRAGRPSSNRDYTAMVISMYSPDSVSHRTGKRDFGAVHSNRSLDDVAKLLTSSSLELFTVKARRLYETARSLGPKDSDCPEAAAAWEAYREHKKGAWGVTYAGTFTRRTKQGLKSHAGLCLLEIDDVVPGLVMPKVQAVPEVRMAYRSTSGNGVHIVFSVSPAPKNNSEHRLAFAACAARLDDAGIRTGNDESCKDVTRMAFLPHAPERWYRPCGPAVEWRGVAGLSSDPEDPCEPVEESGSPDREVDRSALQFLPPPLEPSPGINKGSYNARLGWCASLKSLGFTPQEITEWGGPEYAGWLDEKWENLPTDPLEDARNRLRGTAYANGWRHPSLHPETAQGTGWGGGRGKNARGKAKNKRIVVDRTAAGLHEALCHVGFDYRVNERSGRHELRPVTEDGQAIAEVWDARVAPDGFIVMNTFIRAHIREIIRDRCLTPDNRTTGGRGTKRLHLIPDEFREFLNALAAQHHADPFKLYLLDRREGDGEDIFGRFFPEAFSVCPGDLHTADYLAHAARLLFLPCIGRTFDPGCEASTILVLIGEEGAGKSWCVKSVFPVDWQPFWFTDTVRASDTGKILVEKMSGKVLGEFGELVGLLRSEAGLIRSNLSSVQESGVRKAFKEDEDDYPRRFHLVGTANDNGMGVLPAGEVNRRYWPVRLPANCRPEQAVAWISHHRDQLWGQAMREYLSSVGGLDSRGQPRRSTNQAWRNSASLREEARSAADSSSSVPHGVGDIVDDIIGADFREGVSMARMLWTIEALGPNDAGGDCDGGSKERRGKSLLEYAAAVASGSGKLVADAVAAELRQSGWEKRKGRSRMEGGNRQLWWPPTAA